MFQVFINMYYAVISLVAQMVKSLSAMQATWVRSLGEEGPLERKMATHSSILAWKIPWTVEPGGLYIVCGVTKSWTRLSNKHTTHAVTRKIL